MKKIKKGDLLLILFILLCEVLLIFVFAFPRKRGNIAVIITDKEKIEKSLEKDETFVVTSNGIKLKIKIENGSICVEDSECKNKVCVNTGRISKSGQTVICSPAKLMITVESIKNESKYDGFVG